MYAMQFVIKMGNKPTLFTLTEDDRKCHKRFNAELYMFLSVMVNTTFTRSANHFFRVKSDLDLPPLF